MPPKYTTIKDFCRCKGRNWTAVARGAAIILKHVHDISTYGGGNRPRRATRDCGLSWWRQRHCWPPLLRAESDGLSSGAGNNLSSSRCRNRFCFNGFSLRQRWVGRGCRPGTWESTLFSCLDGYDASVPDGSQLLFEASAPFSSFIVNNIFSFGVASIASSQCHGVHTNTPCTPPAASLLPVSLYYERCGFPLV